MQIENAFIITGECYVLIRIDGEQCLLKAILRNPDSLADRNSSSLDIEVTMSHDLQLTNEQVEELKETLADILIRQYIGVSESN